MRYSEKLDVLFVLIFGSGSKDDDARERIIERIIARDSTIETIFFMSKFSFI